jgi:hypothetical protein
MILLPPDLRAALSANALASRDGRLDPVPMVKLFNPLGAGTWLATELYDDGDTLFGLADLGFGCPELGTFSLSEIERIRLPFGLAIERDIGFATTSRLSVWAECARRAGSIIWAETLLNRAAQSGDSDLSPGRDQPGGG